jgi:hypothetical protein
MPYLVPYLVGGLTALLAMDYVPPATKHLGVAAASLWAHPAASDMNGVNRGAKSDRLALPRPAQGAGSIATVEVVGVSDPVIVYRDRDGRELFRTDPVSNVTIITKGVRLPEVTVREHSGSAVKPVPVEVPREQVRDRKRPGSNERKLMVGCEPSFSPVASPSMAHHTGRCMA